MSKLDNKFILVVDDDEILGEYLVTMINRMGLRGSFASNGLDAVRIAEQELPGIIICDYLLADMSGLALCKVFRAHPKLQNAILLIFTAKICNEEEIENFHNIADSWISKLEGFVNLRRIIQDWARIADSEAVD